MHVEDGVLSGIIVENKDGRGVIRASTFIDASGTADLATRVGLETYYANRLQPGITCAKIAHWGEIKARGYEFSELYHEHCEEFGPPETFIWGAALPGGNEVELLAGTRVTATCHRPTL